jgi:hypothetical protein
MLCIAERGASFAQPAEQQRVEGVAQYKGLQIERQQGQFVASLRHESGVIFSFAGPQMDELRHRIDAFLDGGALTGRHRGGIGRDTPGQLGLLAA